LKLNLDLFAIKLLKTFLLIRFNALSILFKENYTIKKFEKIQECLNINYKLIFKGVWSVGTKIQTHQIFHNYVRSRNMTINMTF